MYLTNLLENHIKKFNWFQKKVAGDFLELKKNVKYLNSSINALKRGQVPVHKASSEYDEKFDIAVGTLTHLSTQLIDKQSSLHTELSGVQDRILLHVKEINSKVNVLAGPWECGGTTGWRRVGFFDMRNLSNSCPSEWQTKEYFGKRMCSRTTLSLKTCDATYFPVGDILYSKICGRIMGYQFGGTVAFLSYHEKYARTIDDSYVDGISVTYSHPRKHIWTFAAGGSERNQEWATTCPCDASIDIDVPPFVSSNYFCESGNNNVWADKYEMYGDDILWDGHHCSFSSRCCSFNNPPYFTKTLPLPTSEHIEVRLCGYTVPTYANVLIELLELYVQ